MKKLALYAQVSLLISMIAFCHAAGAQQTKIDSLTKVLITQDNDTFKVKILYSLSTAYVEANQPDKGIEFARKGIELSKVLKFENGVAICLQNAGLAFYYMGQFDSALIQFEKQLEIVRNLKDSISIASCYDNIGMVQHHFGNYETALNLRITANKIYEKYNNKNNLAAGYNWIGNVYKDQGKYDSALENYLKSVDNYKFLNDSANIAYPLLNLSSIYRLLKQFDKAKEYAIEAKKRFEKSGNLNGAGSALYRFALILLEEDKANDAIKTLKEAKDIFVKTKNFYFLTLTNQFLGTCYLEIGEIDKASLYFKNALDDAIKVGDKSLLATVYENIGGEYFSKGNYKNALTYLRKSSELLTELNDVYSLKEISLKYIELFSRMNQSDSTIAYLNIYQQLSDSLYNQQTTTTIAEMQTKYETSKKEQEIQLAAIKINQQKSWVIFLVVLVFVLLVNSLFFYLHLQHKHKKNLQIAKANMERDLLIKEKTKARIRNSVSDQTTKKILVKLIKEVEDNKCYREPELNISNLAQKAGTNREYLSQIIHKTYNKNFNDFVNYYRVQEAVEILKKIVAGEQDDWTMDIVAEKSGFKYTSTFYPAFKQAMGMSPSEFKKALKIM